MGGRGQKQPGAITNAQNTNRSTDDRYRIKESYVSGGKKSRTASKEYTIYDRENKRDVWDERFRYTLTFHTKAEAQDWIDKNRKKK